MKNSPDPSFHRQCELQMIRHIERLLADDRLRLDTTLGARAVTTLRREVGRGDHAVDLKRLMSEVGVPDRELQSRMPIGEVMEVTLSRSRWWLFSQVVARMRVLCVSPSRDLLKGSETKPMTPADVQKVLSTMPPPVHGAPTTLLLVSTGGFTPEARELADRRADRVIFLAEPNQAGGWRVSGPPPLRAIAELFDPEADADKRRRVHEQIDAMKLDLISGGISAERLAAKVQLPQQLVEAELKAYAGQYSGLVAKRLDGRLVLYREGTSTTPAVAMGGSDMPFIDRVRSLFARKGEDEKKISFLSERRAALTQQRDRSYEDMGMLERQEADLRREFKETTGNLTKRRITSQLLQLRKEIERRQQLLGVLNQQISVVSTHLHSLELVQQGKTAQLPNAEEITEDAVRAEEMLAELEANTELAGSSVSSASTGMTEEEQALYEELEREANGGAAPTEESVADSTPRIPSTIADRESPPPLPTSPGRERQRTAPEAG